MDQCGPNTGAWKNSTKLKQRLPVKNGTHSLCNSLLRKKGLLFKREWWRTYTDEYIPPLQHVIQSYDTAFLKKESADFSAITTWGLFYPDQDSPLNLILLDAVKGRYEFPELRRRALQQYKYWQPETVIIEAKASGLPLTYELDKWISQLLTLLQAREMISM